MHRNKNRSVNKKNGAACTLLLFKKKKQPLSLFSVAFNEIAHLNIHECIDLIF